MEGAVAGLQAVLPAMRGRPAGRIVLVSSDVARHRGPGTPGLGIYGMSKAALAGLANGLIAELGGEILVNFLGSPANGNITGETLNVTGGA